MHLGAVPMPGDWVLGSLATFCYAFASFERLTMAFTSSRRLGI